MLHNIKNIIKFTLLILTVQLATSQNRSTDRIKNIQNILKEGQYSFNILETQVENKSSDKITKYINPVTLEIELTDSEIDYLINESVNIKLISTRIENYKISHIDSIIKIESVGNYIPSIVINLSSNIVELYNQKLYYNNAINVLNDENLLESAWNGYQWKSSKKNHEESIRFEFTIGQLKKNEKIYIKIIGQDSNGIVRKFKLIN